MKKILFPVTCLVAFGCATQNTKTTDPEITAASLEKKEPVLANLNDSVSYAIGLSVAKFYMQQGIDTLNGEMVSHAIQDVFGKQKELLTDEEANTAVMRLLNPGLFKNIEEGERFLAENKNRSGVNVTASGLQYEIIKQGAGPKPLVTDTVEVHYAGTLINGQEFDNSYKRGAPLVFPLRGVIKGWIEALQLMPVGSKYKLYIPHTLGYGMNDQGQIPGGSVLVFEVDLLGIKGK